MILTDDRAKSCVKAALTWMRSHNVKWLKTEEKIYSKEYDYAGTMDGLAYVDSCSDPACCTEKYTHRLCLIDWKSSNYLKVEYCFQTAAYQQALQEEQQSAIESRWVLRLGKNEEEAGKFEPWFLSNADFKTDLDAFLACLSLTRLVDSVEERMKHQKGTIRSIKKQQRETAKALAKEQEKLQKAMDKASAKLEKEKEKVRIKAEAKLERERLKAEKKAPAPEVLTLSKRDQEVFVEALVNPPEPNEALKEATCTSTSSTGTTSTPPITLGSMILLEEPSLKSLGTPVQETPQPVATTLTAARERPLLHSNQSAPVFEESYIPKKFSLPMEG